jgi:hypothetical protein
MAGSQHRAQGLFDARIDVTSRQFDHDFVLSVTEIFRLLPLKVMQLYRFGWIFIGRKIVGI